MSIPGITPTPRVAPTVADTPTASTPARQGNALSEVEIDPATQLPVQPRFPWLSRLSHQLEGAARQKPAFAPAPILGDNVDRSA